MNILLTTSAAPKISPFFTTEKRPPLGVGFLISVLRKEKHKVFFIDNYLEPSNFIEEGFLQDNNIDFVGIYANTICYRDTLRMLIEINNIREKNLWNGKIIVGGPHTSVALDSIPLFVDYVVQGEGEKTLLDIIDRKTNERIVKRERMSNLDDLPFQPWDIFTKMGYDYSCEWLDIRPVFTMNTSRGCPFNCSFCSVDSIWGRRYTYLSAKRIISEIEYLIENYSAKAIYFREDNFTLNKNRVLAFCEGLISKELNIQWACETRVDSLCDEELVKLMSVAGCRAVYLGVESGSQRILDILNKQITVEQIEKAIRLCKKYHIRCYCSLITGVPGETYEDYLSTRKLMRRLKPYAVSFNVFVGIPNSQLYRYVLDSRLYEHIDDVGLVYLPGYDTKTKYFYGKDSGCFVDYKFKRQTKFDKQLLKHLNVRMLNRAIANLVRTVLPRRIVDGLRGWIGPIS
ncbi:MAG: B12-binding domain-containing radical SAM protein [Sedimentisphaerales bacterium]|nr:B12-binding domain-containing radical SAM protein [Sedimentisphaerales bacterium]